MADRTTGGPSKGKTHGGDQTALPGQAAGQIPFGVKSPQSTGAPGTGGAGYSSDVTEQTPVPATNFGAASHNTDTGAPGTSGSGSGVATGATYTKTYDGAYSHEDANGGSVDTESQANKYGTDTGIPGLHVPTTTGAPGHITNGSQRIH